MLEELLQDGILTQEEFGRAKMRLLAGRELPPDEEAEQGTLLYSRAIKALKPLDDEDVDDGPTADPGGFESSLVPTELAGLEPGGGATATASPARPDPGDEVDTIRRMLMDSTTQERPRAEASDEPGEATTDLGLPDRTTRPRRIGEPVTVRTWVEPVVTATVETPLGELTAPRPRPDEVSEVPVIQTDLSGVDKTQPRPPPVSPDVETKRVRPVVLLMVGAVVCAVGWCAGIGFLLVRLFFG